MYLQQFERLQTLAISCDQAWDFFSNPMNLPLITPPDLGFRVIPPVPERMYQGMLVQYTVTPIGKIPVSWVTEITHVREGSFFVDEQRFGPYRFWHHQHFFEEVSGGTRMRDVVSYGLPFAPCSSILLPWVKKRLAYIFDYRYQTLLNRFGDVTSY